MKFGITTVYVTHDQTEAISMGDRIAVMEKGKIIQVGTYDELYYHPVNRFVAGFVGKPPMNFFEGEISERNHFKTDDFSLSFPLEKLAKFNGNGKLFLGIRPEDICLSSDKNLIKGIVKAIEPNFEENTKTIYLGLGNNNCYAKVDKNVKLDVGYRTGMIFDIKKVYLFSEKQKRLKNE